MEQLEQQDLKDLRVQPDQQEQLVLRVRLV
jgi:hypothetical protein